MTRFIRAYVKSMRLYYAFITGIAGWVGLSFYQFVEPERVNHWRSGAILALLFLAWGINQIINDYLGVAEDRINAPHRPMVTGELHPTGALVLSVILLVNVVTVTFFLNPWAIVPLVAGTLLNVLYERAKGWSLAGNVVFGISIAMCTAYGFLAAGPTPEQVFTTQRVTAFILVALLNGLMTYYTYFKDYHGDRLAGKRTFIVKYGIDVGRYAGILGAFLPTLAFCFFLYIGWLPARDILFKEHFAFCGIMTLFLQAWTAVSFFRHPSGPRAYFGLVTNIRACVAGQVAIIAMFNGPLALYLLCGSYVFIGFLFDLYKDPHS